MLVKAVKYDVIRLERLKNEPERMEEYLNFKKGSTQKPLRNISNQRKTEETPSYTTKEIEHEPEAE